MAAELLKRQFTREIKPILFPSSLFLTRALNDNAFVNNNSVELPHSGTLPDVEVDRATVPATITQRTDAPTNYVLEELTTSPTLIKDSEELTVAYGKRQSVMMQHGKKINTKAADRALFKWAGGAVNYVPTTGNSKAAKGTGQTGNRRKIILDNILEMKERFHSDDVMPDNEPVNGIAVVTPQMMSDILTIEQLTDAEKFGRAGLPEGVVMRALGFDWVVRSRVLTLDGADTLKAEGAAGAATDQDAALFYHPDYVRRALGSVKVYVDDDKPEYYGSIMSTMVRFGASPARNDNKGVYLLFEDTI